MPVYDDRTYADARRRELTVPRSLDRPDQPPVPDQSGAIDTPSRLRPASSHQDLPPTLDRADQTELADSGRWSKAGLRQRLEHLPPGHPSSLRSDDPESGEARGFMEPEMPESPAARPTRSDRTTGVRCPGSSEPGLTMCAGGRP